MNYTFLALLTLSMISISIAETNKTNQRVVKGTKNFTQYICKQKSLPVVINYQIKEDTISVEIKAESDLKNYRIETARGVDGLKVLDFKKDEARELVNGASDESHYRFTRPSGRSYFVLDITAEVSGKKKLQVVSIPIGEFSKSQIRKMKSSTVSVDPKLPGEEGEVEKLKIHRMKSSKPLLKKSK